MKTDFQKFIDTLTPSPMAVMLVMQYVEENQLDITDAFNYMLSKHEDPCPNPRCPMHHAQRN